MDLGPFAARLIDPRENVPNDPTCNNRKGSLADATLKRSSFVRSREITTKLFSILIARPRTALGTRRCKTVKETRPSCTVREAATGPKKETISEDGPQLIDSSVRIEISR